MTRAHLAVALISAALPGTTGAGAQERARVTIRTEDLNNDVVVSYPRPEPSTDAEPAIVAEIVSQPADLGKITGGLVVEARTPEGRDKAEVRTEERIAAEAARAPD